MTREILLTKNQTTLVGEEDFDWLNQWKWFLSGIGYAVRNSERPNRKTISMHRLIMGVTNPKIQVDHINGNRLYNLRSNLRICTQAQNIYNQGQQCNNTSGYKGVVWSAPTEKWLSQIRADNQHYHLGLFIDPIDAAKAYDIAARKYHGEFARLNFPEVV